MHRALASTIGLLLLLPIAPGSAHPTGQEVLETVIGPPLPAKNVSRGGRSLVILSRELGINGVGGYYFSVNPDTIGAPFVLKPAGKRDVDVFFYQDLGNLADVGPTITGEYASENTNGEKGFVPPGTNLVVIYFGPCVPECTQVGGPPAYVSFSYRAELTPVITLDGTPEQDLGVTTMHAGGSVFLSNTTAEPVTVRSVAADGEGNPLFQTEPFTGKMLFDLSVTPAGEYPIVASNGAEGTLVIA